MAFLNASFLNTTEQLNCFQLLKNGSYLKISPQFLESNNANEHFGIFCAESSNQNDTNILLDQIGKIFEIYFDESEKGGNTTVIIGVSVTVVLIVIIVGLIANKLFIWKRKRSYLTTHLQAFDTVKYSRVLEISEAGRDSQEEAISVDEEHADDLAEANEEVYSSNDFLFEDILDDHGLGSNLSRRAVASASQGTALNESESSGGPLAKVLIVNFTLKNGRLVPFALKSIRNRVPQGRKDEALAEILAEIEILKMLKSHRNVVKCLGAFGSKTDKYHLSLIMEYCSGGDLREYLIGNRIISDDVQQRHVDRTDLLKSSHLMRWAEDIAAGVEHLHSKRIVHRDLAARNILLAARAKGGLIEPDNLFAKIADFGMSKDLNKLNEDHYWETNPTRSPVRWFSIETLETYKFTLESDIWSLGVVFWEMFDLGRCPYSHRFRNNDQQLITQLTDYLRNGELLPEPEYSNPDIWDLMHDCWNHSPEERPFASEVKKRLHLFNEKMAKDFEEIRKRLGKNDHGSSTPPYYYHTINPIAHRISSDDEPNTS